VQLSKAPLHVGEALLHLTPHGRQALIHLGACLDEARAHFGPHVGEALAHLFTQAAQRFVPVACSNTPRKEDARRIP
jgi:hypothetical protein